jgi:hypothetical protein
VSREFCHVLTATSTTVATAQTTAYARQPHPRTSRTEKTDHQGLGTSCSVSVRQLIASSVHSQGNPARAFERSLYDRRDRPIGHLTVSWERYNPTMAGKF